MGKQIGQEMSLNKNLDNDNCQYNTPTGMGNNTGPMMAHSAIIVMYEITSQALDTKVFCKKSCTLPTHTPRYGEQRIGHSLDIHTCYDHMNK